VNVGIFGGTFNPPHVGHLIVAERAREDLGLHKVLFVPSFISPHKQHEELAAPRLRLEMVGLALRGQELFETSSLEIDRGGVSYTVDTLEHLRHVYTGDNLFLLIGMDNLAEFSTWRCPERIAELARVVVMTRPGFHFDAGNNDLRQSFAFCQVPEIGISSRGIRERVKDGKSIRFLVPPAVESFISQQRLYRV